MIVPVEVTLYLGFFDCLQCELLIRVPVLYQSYLTKGPFAEEFDWLISIDARVEEALAFKDLSMTVLNSLRAVEVNELLLSCVRGHYCKAEVTVNSSCGVL